MSFFRGKYKIEQVDRTHDCAVFKVSLACEATCAVTLWDKEGATTAAFDNAIQAIEHSLVEHLRESNAMNRLISDAIQRDRRVARQLSVRELLSEPPLTRVGETE